MQGMLAGQLDAAAWHRTREGSAEHAAAPLSAVVVSSVHASSGTAALVLCRKQVD